MNLAIGLEKNFPLQALNSWRVNGVAQYYACPKSVLELQSLLRAVPTQMPITWLGLGSNVLVSPYIEGLVIHTRGLKSISFDGTQVIASAGVACAKLAKFCCKHDLVGAEFFAGIPGTVGGALAMNAGAFGSETWQVVAKAQTIDRKGQLYFRTTDDFEIGYRRAVNQRGEEAFVGAVFELPQRESAGKQGLLKIKELLSKRNMTQPIGTFNCGSVFTNPDGDFAARLIEQAGLKGFQCGGAIISPKHANFIINSGAASFHDIYQLITVAQDTVVDKFGVKLEPEVKIIGNTRSHSE